MVCVWAGKGFPDMRQNDRRIEFIRADTVRRKGSLKGESALWGVGANSFYNQRRTKKTAEGRH